MLSLVVVDHPQHGVAFIPRQQLRAVDVEDVEDVPRHQPCVVRGVIPDAYQELLVRQLPLLPVRLHRAAARHPRRVRVEDPLREGPSFLPEVPVEFRNVDAPGSVRIHGHERVEHPRRVGPQNLDFIYQVPAARGRSSCCRTCSSDAAHKQTTSSIP